jgi:hypothetical protein
VEAGNAESLAKGITKILEDHSLGKSLQGAGFRQFKNYSWSYITKKNGWVFFPGEIFSKVNLVN